MRVVLFFLIILPLTLVSCQQALNDQSMLASIDRELIEMAKKDQAARKNRSTMEMISVDKANSIRLKEIIAQYGWPDSMRFSKGAGEGAWLILQHATHDRVFQKESLKLMKETSRDKVNPGHLAYLEDQVSLFENGVQIYGTQGYCVGSKFILSPIKNEKNINIRRKNVNLPPIEAYIDLTSKKACN